MMKSGKYIISYFQVLFMIMGSGCQNPYKDQNRTEKIQIDHPDSIYGFLVIQKNGKISAASKRALERNYA